MEAQFSLFLSAFLAATLLPFYSELLVIQWSRSSGIVVLGQPGQHGGRGVELGAWALPAAFPGPALVSAQAGRIAKGPCLVQAARPVVAAVHLAAGGRRPTDLHRRNHAGASLALPAVVRDR